MTTSDPTVYFDLVELTKQTRCFADLLEKFDLCTDIGPLMELHQGMEQLCTRPSGTNGPFEIREGYPLTLRGAVEKRDVTLEIACKWLGTRFGDCAFGVDGIATTKVLLKDKQEHPLALWRLEVGAPPSSDKVHPGPYFHIQVLGRNQTRDKFTGELFPFDVPRFPSFPPTPTAVIEHAITEFFCDEWSRLKLAQKNPWDFWSSIERQRWMRFLNWQVETIGKTGDSPLGSLKRQSPLSRMLPR